MWIVQLGSPDHARLTQASAILANSMALPRTVPRMDEKSNLFSEVKLPSPLDAYQIGQSLPVIRMRAAAARSD